MFCLNFFLSFSCIGFYSAKALIITQLLIEIIIYQTNLEINASKVLFHLMVYLVLESVGSKLFVIPKSFELFINLFSKATLLPRFEPSISRKQSCVDFMSLPIRKSRFVHMRETKVASACPSPHMHIALQKIIDIIRDTIRIAWIRTLDLEHD